LVPSAHRLITNLFDEYGVDRSLEYLTRSILVQWAGKS
jgi:hypothetical protein